MAFRAAIAQIPHITLEPQLIDTDALLIGVSPVDESIVWVSGANGTAGRTTDGGATWLTFVVPGADSLQFRDVHGVDEHTAYLLSSGSTSDSRIYKTEDGGSTWTMQYMNPGPGGFFDCFDFWDADHGIAFSDSHEGTFIMIKTVDGGTNWVQLSSAALPAASDGEGSFAASGTCLQAVADSTVVIGTGAGASARLLRSDDRGVSWRAYETPITDGTLSSGIASVSFLNKMEGFAFGLELSGDDAELYNAAMTRDGGATWTVLPSPQLPDVYGGAHVPGTDGPMLVAVGPKGIDYSPDGGQHWTSLSKLDHWGVAFSDPFNGWATGPGGRITKLTVVAGRR
jgi:photosystem II stability/assembly factor-like uncharacterized protein